MELAGWRGLRALTSPLVTPKSHPETLSLKSIGQYSILLLLVENNICLHAIAQYITVCNIFIYLTESNIIFHNTTQYYIKP